MTQQRFTSAQFQALAASKRRKILGAEGTEHHLQVECVRWFRFKHGKDGIIYAVPNGGKRTLTEGAIKRFEGMTVGIPDLHIPVPRKGYASLYIEMKNGKAGRLSENQKEMIELLRKFGNKVEVVRTLDEFMAIVDDYFA